MYSRYTQRGMPSALYMTDFEKFTSTMNQKVLWAWFFGNHHSSFSFIYSTISQLYPWNLFHIASTLVALIDVLGTARRPSCLRLIPNLSTQKRILFLSRFGPKCGVTKFYSSLSSFKFLLWNPTGNGVQVHPKAKPRHKLIMEQIVVLQRGRLSFIPCIMSTEHDVLLFF